MLTRTLGSFLRGKATASQIIIAAVLGGVFGFVPAALSPSLFWQAPALALSLLCLVLVLNANLAVFGGVAALAKALSMVLLPVSVGVGQTLLSGPTAPLFATLSNAPVTAWFGLEYYATTGGILLGLVFGAFSGALLWKLLSTFRRRMAAAEKHSELYQRLARKPLNRLLIWVFLGKKPGKMSYEELANQGKRRLPIRYAGVALVGVFLVSVVILHGLLGSSMARSAMQSGLEKWNTATVDLAGASLNLVAGQASLEGVALADPKQLDHDLFSARQLKLRVNTGDLLARRLVIEKLVSADAKVGAKRASPGRMLPRPAAKAPPAKRPDTGKPKTTDKPGTEKSVQKRIDEYLKEAKVWKKRLAQASVWLGKLAGSDEDAGTDAERGPEPVRQAGGGIDARVYAFASNLRTKAPAVLIRNLKLEGVAATYLTGEQLDIHAKNLSSQPWLVSEPFELTVRARSGKFEFQLKRTGAKVETSFHYRGVPVDDAMAAITWPGKAPLSGGTLDLSLGGSIECRRDTGTYLDLPLDLVFHDTTVHVAGVPETKVKKLSFPLGLHGPLASPSITFRPDEFTKAVVEAGKQQLADQLKGRGKKLLEQHAPEADKALKAIENKSTSELDAAKKAAEEKAKQTSKKVEDEAKKSLQKVLPKGLWPTKPPK